jgi:hypothetical protein
MLHLTGELMKVHASVLRKLAKIYEKLILTIFQFRHREAQKNKEKFLHPEKKSTSTHQAPSMQ